VSVNSRDVLFNVAVLLIVPVLSGYSPVENNMFDGGGLVSEVSVDVLQYELKKSASPVYVTSSGSWGLIEKEMYTVDTLSVSEYRVWVATLDSRNYAKDLLDDSEQFICLEELWDRESNWNPSAVNPSSGAYGIPQAYPAGKLASAGADWRTNPETQINWGLEYIENRYGEPCNAWAHSEEHNWY